MSKIFQESDRIRQLYFVLDTTALLKHRAEIELIEEQLVHSSFEQLKEMQFSGNDEEDEGHGGEGIVPVIVSQAYKLKHPTLSYITLD